MAYVLIVDDEPAVGLTLARMLESEGHRVTCEETGQAGLHRLAADHPDAVILDMRMPMMGGLEFLRTLRTVPIGAVTPVAILTGDYFIKDEILAELGRLGALVRYKPVWMDDLIALMRDLLGPVPPTP